tara:strand:+ start:302 stop:463 length:162 start_codon:yes stop_codon:yes gene_type:complete
MTQRWLLSAKQVISLEAERHIDVLMGWLYVFDEFALPIPLRYCSEESVRDVGY